MRLLTYCHCNRPDDGSPMVRCDTCRGWFHVACLQTQRPMSGPRAPPAGAVGGATTTATALPTACRTCAAVAAAADTTPLTPLARVVYETGYALLPGVCVPSPALLAECARGRGQAYRALFRTTQGPGRRWQRDVTARDRLLRRDVVAPLRAALVAHFPAHILGRPVVIRSRPGCAAQPAHADYPVATFDALTLADYPLGCLVALEPGVRLLVWEGVYCTDLGYPSDADALPPCVPTEVAVPPGAALVFRGDLIHAGAAYATSNYRLHCYLATSRGQPPPNRTWRVDTHGDAAARARVLEV